MGCGTFNGIGGVNNCIQFLYSNLAGCRDKRDVRKTLGSDIAGRKRSGDNISPGCLWGYKSEEASWVKQAIGAANIQYNL